jgi:hypothetical protein
MEERDKRAQRAWTKSEESKLDNVVMLAKVGVSTEVVHATERRTWEREAETEG